MTPKQFIKKAIEGGWDDSIQVIIRNGFPLENILVILDSIHIRFLDPENKLGSGNPRGYTLEEILLDPLAWKAVGKVEGWSEDEEYHYIARQKGDKIGEPISPPEMMQQFTGTEASWYMHRMIDTLVEGKNIEQFLETL